MKMLILASPLTIASGLGHMDQVSSNAKETVESKLKDSKNEKTR